MKKVKRAYNQRIARQPTCPKNRIVDALSKKGEEVKIVTSLFYILSLCNTGGGGPTLFLSVDFVNILPKKGGGQTLMSTKALTKC